MTVSARPKPTGHLHAFDGKRHKGDMNPNPVGNWDNSTTLGVAVPLKWKNKTVCKSGTSFASPVAAAIAANVLEFANFNCNLVEDRSIGGCYTSMTGCQQCLKRCL